MIEEEELKKSSNDMFSRIGRGAGREGQSPETHHLCNVGRFHFLCIVDERRDVNNTLFVGGAIDSGAVDSALVSLSSLSG